MTELSILFVNYNSWRVLTAALESLAAHPPRGAGGTELEFEIIVVDNASPQRDDEAEARIRELIGDRGQFIAHDENGGYAKGMNLAYSRSAGRYVLVSNPDLVFNESSIQPLIEYLDAHPDCGVAAPEGFWDGAFECKLPPNILPTRADLLRLTRSALSPKQTRRYSQRRTREALRVWEATEPVELDMLSGCCFMMTRPFIEQIGLFDEQFPLYYEDTDLSMRVREAGKRIVQVLPAKIVHLYNKSGETDQSEAMARYWTSRRRYYRKWYGRTGGWLYDGIRKLLGTGFAKRRAALPPQPHVTDIGAHNDPPVVPTASPSGRFLVEVSLDPHFYLCAGILGTGDSWSPGFELFDNFGPATYFFRVVDPGSAKLDQLGVYRYQRVFPAEWLQDSNPAVADSAADPAVG